MKESVRNAFHRIYLNISLRPISEALQEKTGFFRAEIVMFTVSKAQHEYVFQPEF